MRRARVTDGEAVLAVLDEAAAWLTIRGIRGWPPLFQSAWLEPDLSAGRVWLAEAGDQVVATFTLGWQDAMWPDDRLAGYLHRFAVRRTVAGLGSSLIAWIAWAVKTQGRDRLRLDCAADNIGLRAYYERAGFMHVQDVSLPTDFALWSPPGTLLSLYELHLAGRKWQRCEHLQDDPDGRPTS